MALTEAQSDLRRAHANGGAGVFVSGLAWAATAATFLVAGPEPAFITLFICGFASPQPVHNDDIAPAVLEAQCHALAALRQPAFELHIGDLDSFTSAAFLAVQEHGHLDRLRDTLAGLAPEVRQAPYAPHLTVGLYRRAVPRATWQQHTRALRDCPPLALPVRELQLLSYAASEPQGALRIEARVALG